MSNQHPKEEKEAEEASGQTPISLKEFLESIPPGKTRVLSDTVDSQATGIGSMNTSYFIELPDTQLHCSTTTCNGIRFFEPDSEKVWLKTEKGSSHFLLYTCKNCERTQKIYAIIGSLDETCVLTKIGEYPPFGLPVPARVISLIGPDKDNFLKGRRAENQGLGIGAFAYYRRIVENQKDRIFDELIRACKKLNAPEDVIQDLEKAKKETQFTKAVESVKHGLPGSLLINGQHNPITLLHSALSEGLHEHTDEECLELAKHIRVVLTDMADKVAQALQNISELDAAVSRLMKGESPKKS